MNTDLVTPTEQEIDIAKQVEHPGMTGSGLINPANGREYRRSSVVISADRALKHANVGNNSPCPCGSGKKYKKCHREDLHNPEMPIVPILKALNLQLR